MFVSVVRPTAVTFLGELGLSADTQNSTLLRNAGPAAGHHPTPHLHEDASSPTESFKLIRDNAYSMPESAAAKAREESLLDPVNRSCPELSEETNTTNKMVKDTIISASNNATPLCFFNTSIFTLAIEKV